MQSLTKELAEVFAEDSDHDRTFYGFPEEELSDHQEGNDLEDEDGTQHHRSPKQQQQVKRSSQPFRLRVALRSVPAARDSTDDDDDDEDKENTNMRRVKKAGESTRVKNEKHVKFEDQETAVAPPSPSEEHGSDAAEDVPDSFLAKREQNIKANKAMLAQLMADLQKMPGGEGLLRKQAGKKPKKERSSRPPRAGGESRKNPERASRRQTRSMGACEEPFGSQEAEVERSLEDELLEVRHAPQRRGAPRPSQSKPHIVRPVEDITEDELQLIADNMTEKVYNRVTGSTCHQCRQKTVDTKTCCRSDDCRGIQGQFCGPCLRNRYGEDVKKALLDPEWRCPPCRGICNCSFCRQRDGRCPTGILFPLAQYHGFSDVHSYLTSLRNKLKSEVDVEM